MRTKIDVVNQRFGRLFVLRDSNPVRRASGTERMSVCLCDCGKIKIVRNAHLKYGKILSCGCQNRDRATKHGCSKSKEYKKWSSMISRCVNQRNPKFFIYGGRGINVCERWKDFRNFFDDMGPCPAGMTLERMDNNLGYCPENCQWETRKHQQRNTRRNHVLTVRGETGCLSELCEKFNIPTGATGYGLVLNRLRRGWSPERAFFEPIHFTHKYYPRISSKLH